MAEERRGEEMLQSGAKRRAEIQHGQTCERSGHEWPSAKARSKEQKAEWPPCLQPK